MARRPFLTGDAAERRQETLDLREQRVLIADKWQVIVARQLDEARTRYSRCEVAPFLDNQAPVAGPMQNERRHADKRQHLTDVHFGVHARQRQRRAGARALAQVVRPPVAEGGIVRAAGRALLDPKRAAPMPLDLLVERFALVFGRAPRIVRRPEPPRVRADHHQRQRPLGVGRGKQAAHRAAF